MNFTRDLLAGAPPRGRALVERARDGRRREWTFAELATAAEALAGTLHAHGLRRGDVVTTAPNGR